MATIAPEAAFDRDTFHLVEKDAHDHGSAHASPVETSTRVPLISGRLAVSLLNSCFAGLCSTVSLMAILPWWA